MADNHSSHPTSHTASHRRSHRSAVGVTRLADDLVDLVETATDASSAGYPDLVDVAAVASEVLADHLGHGAMVGITVHQGPGRAQRLASSDGSLARLDEVAGRVRSPGADTVPGSTVVVDPVAGDRRWAAWAEGASALGVDSVVVVGLAPLRRHPASLDLYLLDAGASGADEVADVVGVSRQLGLTLHQVDLVENLHLAMRTRAVIAQAQGVLMERFSLTPERAMSALRRSSQETHVRVRDLARQVVDAAAGPGPAGDGGP